MPNIFNQYGTCVSHEVNQATDEISHIVSDLMIGLRKKGVSALELRATSQWIISEVLADTAMNTIRAGFTIREQAKLQALVD